MTCTSSDPSTSTARYRRLEEFESDDVDVPASSCASDWQRASTSGCQSTIFTAEDDETNAFQVKGSRTPIGPQDLSYLRRGDHIGWHRPYIIWHHLIVEEVDLESRRILVIHHASPRKGIVKEWIDFDHQRGDCFRFDYSEQVNLNNPPADVINRAHEMIGQRGFHIFRNNCEHFAIHCKTGKRDCVQVRWLGGKIKEAICTFAITAAKSIVKLACDIFTSVAGNAVKVTVAETVEFLGKSTNWVGAGLIALVEALHCGWDIYRMYQARKQGKMTERDFKVSCTQRIVEALLGGGLGILGGIIGSFIPIPGVGTAVGVFIGSLIAGALLSMVGKAAGSYLGYKLGNWLW